MVEDRNLTKILQNQLQGPLSGILSLSQLILLEAGSNPDLRDYAQAIYDRGQRMLSVMENLDDLAKIQAGRFDLRREPLVVNSLIEQLLKDYERLVKLKGLKVSVKVQGQPWGSAPLVTWWGRESLLWGILENLYRNALEAASSAGDVRLTLDLSGGDLVLEVDNAGEVPFEQRTTFFQPQMGDEVPAIGTYVVRTFARALEGDAAMVTGQGRTSVRVTLPQREEEWSFDR